MYQELKGRNGKTVGTPDYIQAINEQTFISKLMDKTSSYNYKNILDALANSLEKYVDVIYQDLRLNSRKLRFINDFTRRDFAKFLERMEQLSQYLGVNTYANNCRELIELYDRSTDKFSYASDNKIYESVKLVSDGGGSTLNKYEREKILDDLRMGYRFDSDDEDKKEFIEKLMNGENDDFIKDVNLWYNFEDNNYSLDGKCGRMIASKDYTEYMMKEIFGFTQDYNFDYVRSITESFDYIKDTVERDLVDPRSYYIRYDYEGRIQSFLSELDRVGVSIDKIYREVQDFFYYDNVGSDEVKTLQRYLITYGFYNGEIDGMLSPDTLEAIDKFLEYLETVDMKKLTAIEVIDNTIDAGGEIVGIVETALENSPELEKIIKDFEINGKTYKIDAKTFKAVGDTATILSIILEVKKDIADDGRIGKRTIIELTSQGASKFGGMVGASAGAILGRKIVISVGELIGAGIAYVNLTPPKFGKEIGGAIGKVTVAVFTVAGSIMVGTWASNKSKKIVDQVIDIS